MSTEETSFTTAARAAVERVREASGADIVALYPYDEQTETFYAPAASGVPEADIIKALPDLADQVHRFRVDEAEGKTPQDLSPSHYGPNAWLLATRRPLISADAAHEVDNSFVRRHKIRAIVGLPLVVGNRVLGLLYLNYVRRDRDTRPKVTDREYMDRLQRVAAEVAQTIDSARQTEEAETLRALSQLVSDFATLSLELRAGRTSRNAVPESLEQVLKTTRLDAGALYSLDRSGSRFVLLASHGCPLLSRDADAMTVASGEAIKDNPALIRCLEHEDLSLVAVLPDQSEASEGVLLLADRDPLILQRRLPVARSLLQTAADLLGAMVNEERLIEDLDETNRTLGAVTRLSTRLLQPGSTKEETLRTAVVALTDPALPELDFEFAALYLLETDPEDRLMVAQSAGSAASTAIDSVPDRSNGQRRGARRRVPAWVTGDRRLLSNQDILAYVATTRRPVIVEARDAADEQFVAGYPEARMERLQVPIAEADGTTNGSVRAVSLMGTAGDLLGGSTNIDANAYRPTKEFTLDADLFAAHSHASLVRVFMPFGTVETETGSRASGVLEAGYHVSQRQRLEHVQIEALGACVATLAVAVETANLYEDVTKRAEQLEIVTEISRTIATSIDLDQALRLIARNMARAIDASVCLIALLEEGGSAWYGAAASDQEDMWRHRRVERSQRNIIFEVTDTGQPMQVEDAQNHELISPYIVRLLGIRSLLALPLIAPEGPMGAVVLGQRDRARVFTAAEVEQASGLASQAAMAIRNARLYAREEEEQHVQKDFVLVGFGQWGQKAYEHLLLLKSFFNFRTHVVEVDTPERRQALAGKEQEIIANGDVFYWDSPGNPARDALALALEPSCYVITYIATPATTHLPLLRSYYELSNVVLIEKPLGAPPDEYREFLDHTDDSVEIVAADHYWFKIEVRLLQLLLTEERNLRAFLDEIEEIEIEILEAQPPGGSGAKIGMIPDLVPHAFAILSLLTPLDRLKLAEHQPLQVGRYQPISSEHETYARLRGSFDHRGRPVKVTIDVGKGVADAKWIKLSAQRRMGGRRSFYKFDFIKGEAIDGTQSALRAATRPIRQPGVRDNAHLSMLRHVVEKKHPAVGILSIGEALRANARILGLEKMAAELISAGQWTPYEQGQRPVYPDDLTELAEAREAPAAATG